MFKPIGNNAQRERLSFRECLLAIHSVGEYARKIDDLSEPAAVCLLLELHSKRLFQARPHGRPRIRRVSGGSGTGERIGAGGDDSGAAAENVSNPPTVVCQCEVERPLLHIADKLSQAGLRLLIALVREAAQLVEIAALHGQFSQPQRGLLTASIH